MDAAGTERAALLGWSGPGPELAAFFAATHPERTLCWVHYGALHNRQEPDYPWGQPDGDYEAHLSAFLREWGSEERVRAFISDGYLDGGEAARASYDEPDFIAWNAALARFAATPASYEAFDRMWTETDIRPLLGLISTPTAVLYSSLDRRDEELARFEASLIPVAQLIGVATPAAVIWVNEPEAIVSAIEAYVASVRHEGAELDRMLATVQFTDVVGSTDRAAKSVTPSGWSFFEKHNQIVRAFLARYCGSEVKTTGDGIRATFDGPARAVKCAQGICEAVRPLGLEVRAGCHTGEIEQVGADVGGVAVHIGARVGALAGPSEVLVTSTVKDLVAGSGLTFEDRGAHRLKGIPETWHLHALAEKADQQRT